MDQKDSQQPVEQLIENRRGKLARVREAGLNPFPARYRVDESVSDVRSKWEDVPAEEL